MNEKADSRREALLSAFITGKLYEILKGSGFVAAEVCIEADQIQTSKTDKGVNDSGNPRDSAENHCYKVEVKETNQSPVYGTDDD